MSNPGLFIGGMLVGGGVGAGITYLVLRRRIDERIEEEVNRFKMDYKKSHKQAENTSEGHSEEAKKPLEKSSRRTKTSLDGETPEVERKDYHKISENYMKPSPKVEPEEADPAESEHPEDDGPDFEFISADEINGLDPEQITYLIWDTEENILQDEYGELIENREYLVGDLLDILLKEHEENGVTTPLESIHYIRNNKIEQVYEIETVVDPDAGIVND